MKYTIVHSLPTRLRLKLHLSRSLYLDEYSIKHFLDTTPFVDEVQYRAKNHTLIVNFENKERGEPLLLKKIKYARLDDFEWGHWATKKKTLVEKEKRSILKSFYLLIGNPLIPLPLRPFVTINGALPVLKEGVIALRERDFNTDVLDASAVGISLLTRDFATAGTTSFLLKFGHYLELRTQYKSQKSLTEMLKVPNQSVWLKDGGEIREIKMDKVKKGDLIIARAGTLIPFDGVIEEGDAMVNQASLTGEPLPIARRPGHSVYARTVIEEGEILVRVNSCAGESKIDKIISLLENSDQFKGAKQSRAEKLADKLVPYMFLTSGLTWLFTGSAVKAASVLMVDYSCALKLTTPLAIKRALLDSSKEGVLIKGGKYIEQLSDVTTFVLDKTGTLTDATPKVIEVVAFNGSDRDEIIRDSACLEEHFPHSVARAVVNYAKSKNIDHAEKHGKIGYIVAHGIVSDLDGNRVSLGSRHFIEEHEEIDLTVAKDVMEKNYKLGHSLLFMSMAKKLVGIIVISDPVKKDAAGFIDYLKDHSNLKDTILITGDSRYTANNVATDLGIDHVISEALPIDKKNKVDQLREEGHVVAMFGDGMNDTLALSSADVGISLDHGADIAKESSNIIILSSHLSPIIEAHRISEKAMKRIKSNNRFIIGVNSGIMLMGMNGLISPIQASLFHNMTTVMIALRSLGKYR